MTQIGGTGAAVAGARPSGGFVEPGSLRARKRDQTRRRIADAAVELVSAQGIAATTVDQIAATAGVGRATFFRYFESKELAVAVGLSDVAVFVCLPTLQSLPAHLGPLEAIRAAHRELAADFDQLAGHVPGAGAAVEVFRGDGGVDALPLRRLGDRHRRGRRPRFADLVEGDPRPRMVGAIAMAATRLACDAWVADGGTGDLPALLERHLAPFDLTRLPAT